MKITIRHVVVQHRIADSVVIDDQEKYHRVGHHPADGWHCHTCNSSRCPTIAAVHDVVTPMEDA
ncbi:hypothetical protein [Jiangella rhizosphaerae]|uniref:Uncharacterized protein n=1 Tax=Jiangella rhizosphaerae TaxID=2293569 RepID=A0A418KPX5_9ACTN|nr:hypothetical protein [Jiangella rhizosphaerae]RIQ21261.1 hypothetical protein DY240_15680 [Jiangella rhizosphaerae]